jgi:hypothetical protein
VLILSAFGSAEGTREPESGRTESYGTAPRSRQSLALSNASVSSRTATHRRARVRCRCPIDDLLLGGDGEPDIVYAGNGHDTVHAFDGVADEIDCGPGRDVAFVDAFDIVHRCEVINPEDYY